jgi:hypothetical protein
MPEPGEVMSDSSKKIEDMKLQELLRLISEKSKENPQPSKPSKNPEHSR